MLVGHPVAGRAAAAARRRLAVVPRRGDRPGELATIVDEEMWRAIRALITEPARKTSPGYGRIYVGSGLYRCGDHMLVRRCGR